ncbi:MAG: DNA polymerase II large subunit [Nanoarchaeota archaeon]|nr:DNA polymerase II large subunit [Nanoarchaeota archaeon]
MNIEEYFKRLQEETEKLYGVATKAREKGFDPETNVDIPMAKNMAERVVRLVSAVIPEIVGKGIPKRIIELEKEFGFSDWRVALIIGKEVAMNKFLKFDEPVKAFEAGVRIALAYITLGIVSAPLEGFVEAKIKKRRDGKDYVAVYYAGPIRASGGTAEAVSVLIADYIRKEMGFSEYDPSEKEIERYVTEINDYHDRVSRLQYHPSRKEIVFLLKNLPVEITGDPTTKFEVSKDKDLPRVETNMIRGGMCLVIAEGIAQKAKKVVKKIHEWGKDFGLENWLFLDEFLRIQAEILGSKKGSGPDKGVAPNTRYIQDAVAGRPIIGYPMRRGGFRLRYGRSRLSGLAACSIHPATMKVTGDFLAIGTQLKIERPGKATALTPCDSIKGPVVLLENGSVVNVETVEQANQVLPKIKKILFLGDILVSHGEFSENGQALVPSPFVREWWALLLEKNMGEDVFLADKLGITREELMSWVDKPFTEKPGIDQAKIVSERLGIALHPEFTLFWNNISLRELERIYSWLRSSQKSSELIKGEFNEKVKEILEKLFLPHQLIGEQIIIQGNEADSILFNLGSLEKENILDILKNSKDCLDAVNQLCKHSLKDKVGIYVGSRMGRPEKAKLRTLKGKPHGLFPVGVQGGRLRSLNAAIKEGFVETDFPFYKCNNCGSKTITSLCEKCGGSCERQRTCMRCGVLTKEKIHCNNETLNYNKRPIRIEDYTENVLKRLKCDMPELVKGPRGTSNKYHISEILPKSILRAKNKTYVNKDGTSRFDMIELPVTHFYPHEISASVKDLKKLGYTEDVYGKPLDNEGQLLELFPQDVILPKCKNHAESNAAEELTKICNFVDEELEKIYKIKPVYRIKKEEDLLGQLVLVLAPHTSAATLGRIIGFSDSQAFYAHPYMHAATRRNCDGDEDCVLMLMDALLNFSRQYLPNRRGGRTMDAPLVMTTMINPLEIDSEVHALDTVKKYPLEFYKATEKMLYPWDVKIDKVAVRLGKPEQYKNLWFTHPTSSLSAGATVSAYKTLATMRDKVRGQMDLADKISAVDADDVARLVIERHFLRDIKGNLRKFSTQQVRCVSCNEKFRRPPLSGKCSKCRGKIIFTIAEGSVKKYVDISMNLGKEFHMNDYLKQVLELLNERIEQNFGYEIEKQTGLTEFIS